MKNILYLHAGAEMYGADKILLETIEGINKKKYRPIVVLPTEGILVEKLKSLGVETFVIDYPILRRKFFNVRGILEYLVKYRKKCKEIVALLDSENIDIIHVNTTAVLEGILLRRKLKAKLLWHVHEIILRPRVVHFIICFLMGFFSDRIVAVSEAVKRHILDTRVINDSKVDVVYNAVEDNNVSESEYDYLYKEFHLSKEAHCVGMIGRINAWKGQSDFVDALEPVLKKNSNVYAIIVGGTFQGEEWRREELEKMISRSSVASQFILSGFRTDTKFLYKMFDVFVLPSTRPDPLPTVVLEAMAAGTSIVGYRHGGICEMVKENSNGLLAVPNDVLDLSNKVSILLNSPKMNEKFGKNSRIRQHNFFSMDRFNSEINSLYDLLLE